MAFPYRLNLIYLIIIFSVLSIEAFSVQNSFIEDIPHLSRININGVSFIEVPSGESDQDMFFSKPFILSYRNNNIIFQLASDDTTALQFYLEGFDKDWSIFKQISYKEYTNLPSGHYTFRARYIEDDKTSQELKPLKIRVLPLWYFSRLAIMLYLIFFAFIIWTFYDHLNLGFAKKQYMLEQIINSRTEDLIIEKEKTEALLANLLPKNTAEEIMSKGKATKMKYNFATVLFSDIQGFTKIAEEMNPEVLIDELDKFFFYFDSVAEKYGIEKIKTIGDAYMCAGGIPEKNRTNPVEVILAALEMRIYMDNLKLSSEIEGMKYWDIRIGIHTGTVVAGVVGHKKMSYDIWGDTVNIASRMESSGEAGKINISGTTYEFVKEFFTCEYRGKMPVKYKGELEMYFVTGIIPELNDGNGGPNNNFIIKIQMIKLQDIEEMIIKLFDDEAPPNLYFHNAALVKSISNQVELLSNAENLPDKDFINLKLASVFLLTGYISDYDKPMEASARLVDEILPRYGFDQENIESTKKIIRNSFTDTRGSLSDNILHDAKYDYLGRVDYMKLTEKLLREITEYGKLSDGKSLNDIQKELLYSHEFVTNTAKIIRNISVKEQIAALLQSNSE